MGHLTRASWRRLTRLLSVCVLLTGAVGAPVLLAATAQAVACSAGAVTAPTPCTLVGTTTVTGGSLALTAPSSLTWASTALTGLDLKIADVNTADQSYIVNDATGSGAGWEVAVHAQQFTSTVPKSRTVANAGTFSINGSTSSIVSTTGPSVACSSGSACTPSVDTVVFPVAITTGPSSVFFDIYSTAAASGMGSMVIGFPGTPVGWWVNLPASTVIGTYTSTISLEVISGP